MKRTISILLLILTISYAGVGTMKLKKTSLVSSFGNIELNIQSNEKIMGIQFDMKYNASELNFTGAEAIPNDFMFEYIDKDNGIIRGLMFSLEGKILNQNDIESLIAFDFTPNNDFDGISTIEFLDVIIAGKDGIQLESSLSSININTSDLIPFTTTLHSSYPNPFNPITQISYELANDENINISVYDARGRHVDELINGFQNSGEYNISWNASNQASGTYFIQMNTENQTMAEKIVLIK